MCESRLLDFPIPLENPLDRVQKISGDEKGLEGDSGKHIIDLSKTITGLNQNTLEPCPMCHFHIRGAIADDIRGFSIDIEVIKGFLDEARLRFSAIAVQSVIIHLAVWVMRAEENAVHARVRICQQALHLVVNLINQFYGEITSCDS